MRGLICIESMRKMKTTVEVKTCLCITPSDPFSSVERSISQASAADASCQRCSGIRTRLTAGVSGRKRIELEAGIN